MRQRTRDTSSSRHRREAPKGVPNRRLEPTFFHRFLIEILPILRSVLGGCCVRAQGVALRATDGVLHAPRTVRQVGYSAYFGTFLLSILLEPTNVNLISGILSSFALLLTSATQPLYAAVLTSCICGITNTTTPRITTVLSILSFMITLLKSPLNNSVALQNGLFLLCLLPHLETTKRITKRTRHSITRRLIITSIIAGTCFIGMPQIGSKFIPKLPRNYRLLAHERGATGLISVLDDVEKQYRLLIADHSILGGRFISPQFQNETIFGQFHVHEAVRLTQGPGNRAICLGLGVGVVAQALHDHGVKVDAVELDEKVAKFSRRYFGLNGPNVIVNDASVWLRNAPGDTYDYAIHDVFTGGAIPASMFAPQTFTDIRHVLRNDGVLALNFVGDISGGVATRALSAIRARLEREWNYVSMYGEDSNATVVNIVFFASNEEKRMTFRQSNWDDALGSTVRHDVLQSFEKRKIGDEVIPKLDVEEATDEVLNKGQWITANLHWKAMRGILNRNVWFALAGADDTSVARYPRWRKRRK